MASAPLESPISRRSLVRLALRTLLLAIIAAVAVWLLRWGFPRAHTATLLSRSTHRDYEKATFSFEHGVRDQSIARNDWDIQFGNGGDHFGVTMVTDDRSRIQDLGRWYWPIFAFLPLPAHPQPAREPDVSAAVGHVYFVHTVDSNSDLYALFRVDAFIPGDRCDISWCVVEPMDRWIAIAVSVSMALALGLVTISVARGTWGAVTGYARARRGCCPCCAYPASDSCMCTECGTLLHTAQCGAGGEAGTLQPNSM